MGELHSTPVASPTPHQPLVSKGPDRSWLIPRHGPTTVCRKTFPETGEEAAGRFSSSTAQRPNARDLRAIRDKERRAQLQRDTFLDAAAFAYFQNWRLDMRITVSWDVCLRHGDHHEGHALLRPAKERDEYLRAELCRLLQKRGKVFACAWARDTGGQHGHHIHLALHWPLPIEELVHLLARVTGSPPGPETAQRSVVAQSECHGWQIKSNAARDEIASAVRWTTYLRDQGPRHLVMPSMEGKVLGVSKAISAKAVEAHREALDAWKQRVGWSE